MADTQVHGTTRNEKAMLENKRNKTNIVYVNRRH